MVAPSFEWNAMVLQTGQKLERLNGISMINMIKKMKRGGLCFVVNNVYYVEADNQHMPNYNPNVKPIHSLYEYDENLHGCSMSKFLAYE